MNHGRAQGAFAGILVSWYIGAIQEDQKRIASLSIAIQQVGSQTTESSLQLLIQFLLDDRDLPLISSCCHLRSPISQMDRFAEQGLHFFYPCQVWAFLDQTLQVADLVRQADLTHFCRRIQLRLPTVAHPNFRFTIAHTCTVPQVQCKYLNHIRLATIRFKLSRNLCDD
jgi:hypothetical protein